MLARLALAAFFLLLPAAAQLTPDQRLADFRNLVDLFLIDSIDRRALPAPAFALQVGDKILKVDGKPVADLIEQFSK